MDFFAFPPVAALLDLAYAGFMGLASLLEPVAGGSAAAAAVVLVTLLVRAALIPVGVSQAKAEQARARLAPALAALRRRFGNDPERLQRETMQLYRDERTSPFAGCLPVLLQAPVVGIVYAVFLHRTIAGHANALLDHTLFGVPLGTSLVGSLSGGAPDAAALAVCGTIALLIAGVGELTRRLLRVPPLPRVADSPVPAAATSLLGVLQFTTAVVALFVPVAAGLYLLTTVAWTLAQRLILRRVHPLP
ncbi:membrane protein insertase YidC [Microbacterium sp. BWT-B31]|uniref:membrane protein insertase YidC n=1 Tax=Microbacterium sp. BWT-B31 TaxID=3232072 RepID=UPI0035288A03